MCVITSSTRHKVGIKWEWKRIFILCVANMRILKQYWCLLACCFERKQSVLDFEVGRLVCLVWLWLYVCKRTHNIYISCRHIGRVKDICSLQCLSHANKFMREQHKTLPLIFSITCFWHFILFPCCAYTLTHPHCVCKKIWNIYANIAPPEEAFWFCYSVCCYCHACMRVGVCVCLFVNVSML